MIHKLCSMFHSFTTSRLKFMIWNLIDTGMIVESWANQGCGKRIMWVNQPWPSQTSHQNRKNMKESSQAETSSRTEIRIYPLPVVEPRGLTWGEGSSHSNLRFIALPQNSHTNMSGQIAVKNKLIKISFSAFTKSSSVQSNFTTHFEVTKTVLGFTILNSIPKTSQIDDWKLT